jgi:hypothetical protein
MTPASGIWHQVAPTTPTHPHHVCRNIGTYHAHSPAARMSYQITKLHIPQAILITTKQTGTGVHPPLSPKQRPCATATPSAASVWRLQIHAGWHHQSMRDAVQAVNSHARAARAHTACGDTPSWPAWGREGGCKQLRASAHRRRATDADASARAPPVIHAHWHHRSPLLLWRHGYN